MERKQSFLLINHPQIPFSPLSGVADGGMQELDAFLIC